MTIEALNAEAEPRHSNASAPAAMDGIAFTRFLRDLWGNRNFFIALSAFDSIAGLGLASLGDILYGRKALRGFGHMRLVDDDWQPPRGYPLLGPIWFDRKGSGRISPRAEIDVEFLVSQAARWIHNDPEFKHSTAVSVRRCLAAAIRGCKHDSRALIRRLDSKL